MEKLLIFSDSHGSTTAMQEAVSRSRTSVSTVIHLGDGTDDAEHVMQDYPAIPLITVRGNREDYLCLNTASPREMTLELDGCRIFMCHGHTYNVKSSMQRAIYRAIEEKANVLLYGHTHIADYSIVSGFDDSHPLHVVNPGATSFGYAELVIKDAKPQIKLISNRHGL